MKMTNKKIIYLWIMVLIAEILLIFSLPNYRCSFHVDPIQIDPITGKDVSCKSWSLFFQNIPITNFYLEFRNQTAGKILFYGLFALPIFVGILLTLIWKNRNDSKQH